MQYRITGEDGNVRVIPPALREERALPDVDLAAARVSKVDSATLWKSLTAGKSGLTKVWLNGRRELSLEHSVPQIGAPAALAVRVHRRGHHRRRRGLGHRRHAPDLAGRVSEAANFGMPYPLPYNDSRARHRRQWTH